MVEYNFGQLIICILISVFAYVVLTRKAHVRVKIFYALFLLFFTVYSGIGGTIAGANLEYMVYYYTYLFSFVFFSLVLFPKTTNKEITIDKRSFALDLFLFKYANLVIVVYYFVLLASLVFPENRLGLLLSPPSPDINARLDFYREGADATLFHYLGVLINPFFYYALYKFKNRPLVITLLLIGGLYISYCSNTYLGRESILVALIIAFFTVYHNASEKAKKWIVASSLSAIPIGAIFFVYYSYTRVGLESANISATDAISLLFSQETNYPLLFDSYISNSGKLIGEYFEWFFLLPFPSFLKMGHGGTLFNELFTNVSIDRYSWESGFSIALPGIVGEGIFVFKYLLFIHAFILAFVVKITLKYLCKYQCFLILYFYALIKIPMGIARSGTQGVYSIIGKALIFVIVLYIYQKTHTPKNGNS